MRILDDGDPYLVVAADKGTATFSDIANGIAAEYGFWLGDAFASGGSHGYDHKALGITARGAWESVKRHFRELGHDVQTQPFTVVGIGDMSGDVFGNGMLLSEQIHLVAAFDHRHVFLDPNPDPEASFAERKRLFELPGSSWDDYDRSQLSAGGGVWSRQEKSIPLAPEAREALGVELDAPTPAELMSAILKAPVDLFWNGGIGTFVKASDETHADVGDRSNDAIRVDGEDVRARVVGEGGNLGYTQRGRIEYARTGGRINADFIDNSAGVDTSDHEVNLKILLGIAVAAGDLTTKQRDELLDAAEPDVAAHVLYDNYLQAQILSQEAAVSSSRIEAYDDLMASLEAEGLLEREIEALPLTEEMAERARGGRGMDRPELCVLLAYAKRSLKEAIRDSSLPDDPFLDHEVRRYFPRQVADRFGQLIEKHPLRRDLAAMLTANAIVNDLGITWASPSRLGDRRRACRGRARLLDRPLRHEGRGAVGRRRGSRREARPGICRTCSWSASTRSSRTLPAGISSTPRPRRSERRSRRRRRSSTSSPTSSSRWARRAGGALARRSPGRSSRRVSPSSWQSGMPSSPSLLTAPTSSPSPASPGARSRRSQSAFFLAGERFHLDWLERHLLDLPDGSRFERWASQAVGDDLMTLRREIALRVLDSADGRPFDQAMDDYLDGRSEAYERLNRLVSSLQAQGETSLAALTVALRQVRGLVS